MALIKREYTDQETVITAENLNAIQDAVIGLEDGLFSIDNDKSGEVITITDAANRGFRVFKIFGKTTQDGTPTPDAPVDLVSIGDSGSITVNVTGENDTRSMTISTPNGLPGIPVTSGGNYTDANGQQWVCDEIDLARGVYVQRVGGRVFDGSSDEVWDEEEELDSTIVFRTPARDSVNVGNVAVVDFLCTHMMAGNFYGVDMEGAQHTTTLLYFRILKSRLTSVDVSSFRALIANSPMRVRYVLATPIETPLSAEEIAAYSALYTYKEHTTVSNDASAYMELEYVMDAKKYIDRIAGSGGGSSAKLSNVTLRASAWTGADGLYSQVVSISGVTEYSKVDLLPSVEQLAIFHNKDVAFVTENEDGVVTVFAIGDKPTQDYTMQISITEVTA